MDKIEAAREKVRKPERNVAAQRWRVNALEGKDAAQWLAGQLLLGSGETLRGHQTHLTSCSTPRANATIKKDDS